MQLSETSPGEHVLALLRVGGATERVSARLVPQGGRMRAMVRVSNAFLTWNWRPGDRVTCEVEGAYSVRPVMSLVAGARMLASEEVEAEERLLPVVFAIEKCEVPQADLCGMAGTHAGQIAPEG